MKHHVLNRSGRSEVVVAHNLAQVLVPGGIVITSGIIGNRRNEAEQPLLDAGLKYIDQVIIDDWVTLIMQK